MLLSNGMRLRGAVRVFRPQGEIAERFCARRRDLPVPRGRERDLHHQCPPPDRTGRGDPRIMSLASAEPAVDAVFTANRTGHRPAVSRDVPDGRVRPAPVRRLAGTGQKRRAYPGARSEHAGADRGLPAAAASTRSCRPTNRQEFAEKHDTDFAYEIPNLARFRANVFADRKGRGAVFRVIPSEILTAEKLGLSQHILNLCKLNKGLVLVTGPTGSGK